MEEHVERVGPDLCTLIAGADSGLLGQQIGWVVLVACAVAQIPGACRGVELVGVDVKVTDTYLQDRPGFFQRGRDVA